MVLYYLMHFFYNDFRSSKHVLLNFEVNNWVVIFCQIDLLWHSFSFKILWGNRDSFSIQNQPLQEIYKINRITLILRWDIQIETLQLDKILLDIQLFYHPILLNYNIVK